MDFLDTARIRVRSGRGGDGCVSFRREKNVPFGGPDGGDGGDGGDVWAEAAPGPGTLSAFRRRRHFAAGDGVRGMGRRRAGRRGADHVIRVPAGTILSDSATGSLISDLAAPGQRVQLARGGRGGAGNARFATSVNRAPRRADAGGGGVEYELVLRLKLLADVGLVGLPNAGKSTFLRATTNARPKVADYPFTTLHPNLGVVSLSREEFVLADIPGLIEGAHAGAGLGDRFLGHIERCAALLHLVDCTADDVAADYRAVDRELAQYGAGVPDKPRLVRLTKADARSPEDVERCATRLRAAGAHEPAPLSSVSGDGVRPTLGALLEVVRAQREAVA